MYHVAVPSKTFLWVTAGWICLVAIAGLLVWLGQRDKPPRWQYTGLMVLMGAYLLIRRYPILLSNYEINPDESQVLAQALTLWHHAIYWRFVDGATMGPLSSYLMATPALFGHDLDYSAARWLGFGCTLITIGTTFLAIRNLFGQRIAVIGVFPLVVFLGHTQHSDFVHNTNEQLSLALIGLCLWQFSRISRQGPAGPTNWLFWLSFTASLVPFAKLQGTPSVLVIVIAAFLNLLRQRSHLSASGFWRSLAALLAGGVTFPLIFIGLTVYFGVFSDFVQFYVLGNAAYGSGNSFEQDLGQFIEVLGQTRDFTLFLLPVAALLIARLLWPVPADRRPGRLLFYLALLFVNLYAIIKPGNAFSHYLLYLSVPISLLSAYLLATIRLPATTVSLVLIGLMYTPMAISDVHRWYTHQPASQYTAVRRQMALSGVSRQTLRYAQRGEDLVVWGWMPRYNVETQMPQGVADNHVIRCLLGDPAMQRIHRSRYMQNIRRSKPPVFIDSVGENCLWLNDRSRFAHEVFPELNAFISAYYHYVGEIEQTRIYVRTDRYNRIRAQKTLVAHVDQKRTDL